MSGALSTSGAGWSTTSPTAVQLNGSGYVSVPDASGTNRLSISGQITVAAWVYITACPGDNITHYVVCSGNNTVFLGITGNNGNPGTSQWQVGTRPLRHLSPSI